jgi:acetyl-CoA synthetase
MREIDAFLAARDFLLRHRDDPETAYRGFRWPALQNFNWALDYFDRLADGKDRAGLWIVEETGEQAKLSFDQLRRRAGRSASPGPVVSARPVSPWRF